MPTADANSSGDVQIAVVDADGSTTSDVAYPAPPMVNPSPTTGEYPPPAIVNEYRSGAYPAPQTPTPETSRIPIVPFILERPLKAGDTVVRGTGPANVPIIIVDVFLMGETLGEGVIDSEGSFEVSVPPLETGHWIGVAVNDLSNTDLEFSDFYAQGFRGPGAEQVPQVGFVHDSEFVQ
ncbi:MAG: hypothetical protein ACK4SA_16060 [Caldilinea sp.]